MAICQVTSQQISSRGLLTPRLSVRKVFARPPPQPFRQFGSYVQAPHFVCARNSLRLLAHVPSQQGAQPQAPKPATETPLQAMVTNVLKAVVLGVLAISLALGSCSPALAKGGSGGRIGGGFRGSSSIGRSSGFGSSSSSSSSSRGFGSSSPTTSRSAAGSGSQVIVAPSHTTVWVQPSPFIPFYHSSPMYTPSPPVYVDPNTGAVTQGTVVVEQHDNRAEQVLEFAFIALMLFLVAAPLISKVGAGDGEEGGVGAAGTSVARLQVAIAASDAERVKSTLRRMADYADTTTSEGLAECLQEASLELLRSADSCLYAASDCQVERSLEAAQKAFNMRALEERGKFDQETVSNFGGRRRRDSMRKALTNTKVAEVVVVTLMVAARGKLGLPAVKSNSGLKAALQQLGSLRGDEVEAVEIIWTPEADGDCMGADELIEEYPYMTPM